MTPKYTAASIERALDAHQAAGHVKSWHNWHETSPSRKRPLYTVVLRTRPEDTIDLATLHEAHAFLAGLVSAADALTPRKLADMTPAERREAGDRAMAQLNAELSAAAPQIAAALDAAEAGDLDEHLSPADAGFARQHARDYARPDLHPDQADAYAAWYDREHIARARTLEDLPAHPYAWMRFLDHERAGAPAESRMRDGNLPLAGNPYPLT